MYTEAEIIEKIKQFKYKGLTLSEAEDFFSKLDQKQFSREYKLFHNLIGYLKSKDIKSLSDHKFQIAWNGFKDHVMTKDGFMLMIDKLYEKVDLYKKASVQYVVCAPTVQFHSENSSSNACCSQTVMYCFRARQYNTIIIDGIYFHSDRGSADQLCIPFSQIGGDFLPMYGPIQTAAEVYDELITISDFKTDNLKVIRHPELMPGTQNNKTFSEVKNYICYQPSHETNYATDAQGIAIKMAPANTLAYSSFSYYVERMLDAVTPVGRHKFTRIGQRKLIFTITGVE